MSSPLMSRMLATCYRAVLFQRQTASWIFRGIFGLLFSPAEPVNREARRCSSRRHEGASRTAATLKARTMPSAPCSALILKEEFRKKQKDSDHFSSAMAQPCAWQLPRSIPDADDRYQPPIARLDAAVAWCGSPSDTAAASPAVGTESREAAGAHLAARRR